MALIVASSDAAISADRRWVAFESNADNLVGKDIKGVKQIYLFDRDKDTHPYSVYMVLV